MWWLGDRCQFRTQEARQQRLYRSVSRFVPTHHPPARNARSPRENARKTSLQQLLLQCAANLAVRAFDCDQIATPEPATSGHFSLRTILIAAASCGRRLSASAPLPVSISMKPIALWSHRHAGSVPSASVPAQPAPGQIHAANSLLICRTVPTPVFRPPYPSFGPPGPLDGSNLGRIAVLQQPTPKIDLSTCCAAPIARSMRRKTF